MDDKKRWPTTTDEAVGVLLALLTDEEKAVITGKTRDQLGDLHPALGTWIRSHFGLWQDNSTLLESTRERHPDDAAGVIIAALWQRLQEERPKIH